MATLVPAKAKTHRAYEHVDDLQREVDAFLDREPYEVVLEREVETGDQVYRVRIREQIPQAVSLIAGDVVHNARAALDIVYCDLVVRNGKTVADSDSFPISESAQKSASRLAEIRSRVGKDPAQVVQQIEPYKGGDGHLIWALHRLDILDKHRLLLTAVAAFRSQVISTYFPTPAGGAWGRIPPEWDFPVEDGTEIVLYPADVELKDHDKPNISFEVSLYELTILLGESIGECLKKLVIVADSAVDQLLPFL